VIDGETRKPIPNLQLRAVRESTGATRRFVSSVATHTGLDGQFLAFGLPPGEYVVELPGGSVVGHFGLAVKDYAHSTAPNRRYPDLVTQRLLKAAVAGRSAPYAGDELETLAAHCTEAEDAAKKVERQVTKSAAALLLQNRIGEQFDAIVTGASDKGTWVRLLHPPVEGRLASGFAGLDVGQRLRVQLVSADVERGFIDFRKVA